MNKKIILKILIFAGTVPFLVPIVWGLLSATKNTDFIDFLILYSFLYWPTYLLGLALTLTSAILLKRK